MIPQRALGKNGPKVSAIGYGAMVLEGYYGAADETAAIDTLRHAFDLGVNFIDTADMYGDGHNETLIGRALKGRRDDCFIATKFGIVGANEKGTDFPTGWGFSLKLNGTPEYAARALENSLRRLAVDTIDLWYIHFPDPSTPIEDSVAAMAKAVRDGKVRHLGLSNVSPDQVRRAHAVHPIAAVQYEYSLWRRGSEEKLLPTLRELGIGMVPWSPLGSGFLTGTVNDLGKDDFRNNNPKYAGENLKANTDRFAPLMELAKSLNITPAQLALAWLLHQGNDIVPIPGSRKKERVSENAAAANVHLSPATLRQIDDMTKSGPVGEKTLVK